MVATKQMNESDSLLLTFKGLNYRSVVFLDDVPLKAIGNNDFEVRNLDCIVPVYTFGGGFVLCLVTTQ